MVIAIKKCKISFKATCGEKLYGSLLITIKDSIEFHPSNVDKFRSIIETKYHYFNNTIPDGYNRSAYKVSIFDEDTLRCVLIIDRIPATHFWRDVNDIMLTFRLMFLVECINCYGAWKLFSGKRCSNCGYIKNIDVASEFNQIMEETFGTN